VLNAGLGREGICFSKLCVFGKNSWDSAVGGIAAGYGLVDRGGQISSLGKVKNFLHVVQTGSGAHPASYTMGTGGSFSGGKAAGA
jgi:hypothetical protein